MKRRRLPSTADEFVRDAYCCVGQTQRELKFPSLPTFEPFLYCIESRPWIYGNTARSYVSSSTIDIQRAKAHRLARRALSVLLRLAFGHVGSLVYLSSERAPPLCSANVVNPPLLRRNRCTQPAADPNPPSTSPLLFVFHPFVSIDPGTSRLLNSP